MYSPASRSSVISVELKTGGIAYVYVWQECSYSPPKRPPWTACIHFRDSYISYRRLPPKMQQSPSAVLVGIYLSEVIFPCYFHTGFSYSLNLRPSPPTPRLRLLLAIFLSHLVLLSLSKLSFPFLYFSTKLIKKYHLIQQLACMWWLNLNLLMHLPACFSQIAWWHWRGSL